jgi:polysaccharide deacetylase family protein (PEP-CTERM system associated)
VLNALTVDVEEYFHAENLRAAYPRERWTQLASRVEEPLRVLASDLEARATRATFFVLGWVADRNPGVLEWLASRGHEIGSHGYGHELLTRLSPDVLREDLRRANIAIERATGHRPRGYRAPCFTIGPSTRWALDVLAEEGFDYDSSIFPIAHDRYGDPTAPRFPHRLDVAGRTLVEAPPSTVRLLGRNFPVAGGGYLRLFPVSMIEQAIERLNGEGQPAIVYLHPWELDPDQPVHEGVAWRHRFRHGLGTRGLRAKLLRLLDKFRFGSLEEVLEQRGLLARRPAKARAA